MNQVDPNQNNQNLGQNSNQGFNTYDPFDPFGFGPTPSPAAQPQAQPTQAAPAGAQPIPHTQAPPIQAAPPIHPQAAPPQAQPTQAAPMGAQPIPHTQAQPIQAAPPIQPQAAQPQAAPMGVQPIPHTQAPPSQGAPPIQPQVIPGQAIPAGAHPNMPYGQAPAAAGAQQAPAEPPKPANFKLGTLIDLQNIKVTIHSNNPSIDTDRFLKLLAQSISLSKAEKLRIINSFPSLSDFQINELIRIFQDEEQEFAKLPEKNVPELERLAKKHALDWESIEHDLQQDALKAEELKKQEEIRKKFGL